MPGEYAGLPGGLAGGPAAMGTFVRVVWAAAVIIELRPDA